MEDNFGYEFEVVPGKIEVNDEANFKSVEEVRRDVLDSTLK